MRIYKIINFKYLILFIFSSSLLLSGCVNYFPMGVLKSTKKLELEGEGLLLASFEITNKFRPKFQPKVTAIRLQGFGDDSNNKNYFFEPDSEGTYVHSKGYKYLLRMKVPAGKYVLRGADCGYNGLIVKGYCFMPIHSDITVSSDKVIYLGNIRGEMRERNEDEFRAGPLIPIIDQAITGYYTSTFDVLISDAWIEDEKSFISIFPALEQAEIIQKVMLPFDKERAYKWWGSNGKSEEN